MAAKRRRKSRGLSGPPSEHSAMARLGIEDVREGLASGRSCRGLYKAAGAARAHIEMAPHDERGRLRKALFTAEERVDARCTCSRKET